MKVSLIAAVVLSAAFVASGRNAEPGAPGSDSMERGKYIVERVAMCVECHTPRDPTGRLIRAGYPKGAPVPVKAPPYPKMNWAFKAPAISGLPGYTREQGVHLLTQGLTREGRFPDPPMPAFRFSTSDAEAVVAYLKSLP